VHPVSRIPEVISYGPHPSQVGTLFLPSGQARGTVVLLHGGVWMLPYDASQLDGLAAELVERGWATWNLEYRRLGEVGAGWPGTFDDVARGVAHLAELTVSHGSELLRDVVVAGHSAGGHLALWVAGAETGRVRPRLVVGLAPVADLDQARAARLGGTAVDQLLAHRGATLAATSPAQRLPLGVPQLLAHGEEDEVLPLSLSEHYAARARAAGDEVTLLRLPGTGHFDFLEPGSAATVAWVERLDDLRRG
jgi:acetyl esterase/lipase